MRRGIRGLQGVVIAAATLLLPAGAGAGPGDAVKKLCRITQCEKDSAAKTLAGQDLGFQMEKATDPKIDSTFVAHPPASSTEPGLVIPGARILLMGTGFGPVPGEIHLLGPITGDADGVVKLEELEWDEDGEKASGKVPMWAGVTARVGVKVRLINQWGRVSNDSAREMEPGGRMVALAKGDRAIELGYCDPSANKTICYGDADRSVYSSDACIGFGGVLHDAPLLSLQNETFYGNHQNCTDVSSDEGTDRWEITLLNTPLSDCVVVDVSFEGTVSSKDEHVFLEAVFTDQQGRKMWVGNVHWKTSPADEIRYAAVVWLRCP